MIERDWGEREQVYICVCVHIAISIVHLLETRFSDGECRIGIIIPRRRVHGVI
jgi:hypothetical protein